VDGIDAMRELVYAYCSWCSELDEKIKTDLSTR
jgi:hypothetical protein